MSAPAPEGGNLDTCVFCGAIALRGCEHGIVEWVVEFGQDPECNHETIAGEK